jgi:hypothetical protein
VIEVDPVPGQHVRVTFMYKGRMEAGRINHIEPREWGGQSTATPKIVVIQSKDDLATR